MAAPAVSIVTTFLDAADTLPQTLDSVAAQTFADWEMVLVDDGSTDASRAVADEWAARDSRFRVSSTGGAGRGAALNMGLAAARSDYIAILDADDAFHPRKLELQVAALEERPELALLATRIRVAEAIPADFAAYAPRTNPSVNVIPPSRLRRGNVICHSSVLMRRKALAGVGDYSTTLRVEDYDLWVRLAEAGQALAVLDEPLTLKRIHPGQKFASSRPLRYALSSMRVQLGAIRRLGGSPLDYLLAVARLAARLAPRRARLAIRGQRRP